MSKSKGNVVDPLKLFSIYGAEQVRYYLLKEGVLQYDGGKKKKTTYVTSWPYHYQILQTTLRSG